MRKGLVTVTFIFIQFLVYSQPPPPKPQAIPLDGGITFLLAAGISYGVNKIINNNSNKSN